MENFSKIFEHLRLVFETLGVWRNAIIVYSISVQMLVEHRKPGSCHSNSNPRDRKVSQFVFCAVHYRIALWHFGRSSARSRSIGSRFNDKPGLGYVRVMQGFRKTNVQSLRYLKTDH